MTREQVKEIFDRVLTWPEDRQSDAAAMLTIMEEQDRSGYRLTDEQAAEVRRRLAKKNPKYVSLDEARSQFPRSGA
jgi:NH3-dependent NAD+ synthetase